MSSGRRSNQSGTPTTQTGKKLIQARLPFKSLAQSCPTVAKPGNGNNTRKRKLSAVDDSSRKAKINRITGPSKAENEQPLEISDDESEPVVEQAIELTSDDEPAADTTVDPTVEESSPETPKRRKTRKSAQKSPAALKAVTPKQSRRKSSPRSIRKRKLNVVDEVATVVSEESSFAIKLPLPKKRTKNETKIASTLAEAKKDTAAVGLSTDIDDSSLSEDSSVVKKSQPAANPVVMDIPSTSDEEEASLDVTPIDITENEDVELQSSPKSGEFLK